MKEMTLDRMEMVEGGTLIGDACAAYGTYAFVAALVPYDWPISLAAGAFCAGYGLANLL